jgi:hypothetical protein
MRQEKPAASFIFYEVPVSGRIPDDGSYLPMQNITSIDYQHITVSGYK